MRLKKWPVQISQKIASQTSSHMIQGPLLRKSAFLKGDTNNSTHNIHLYSIMDALVIWFYCVSAAAALLNSSGLFLPSIFICPFYLCHSSLSDRLRGSSGSSESVWQGGVTKVCTMECEEFGKKLKIYRQLLETLLNQSNVMLFLLIVCVATDRLDCL